MVYSKESAKDYLKGNETGYRKERIKVDLEANLVSLRSFANHRCTIAASRVVRENVLKKNVLKKPIAMCLEDTGSDGDQIL